ncbi:MAG: hypothetical protein GY774_01375 [Planctomycetes bacterium]|nr:hypothetical protein [Planctomycetota bacterium]
MVTSIVSIVKQCNKKWHIPEFNESLYEPFIRQQLILRSRETEVLGLTFLFSCVIGNKHIVDSSNDLKQRIQDSNHLPLLSYYNVTSQNRTREFNNPEHYEVLREFNRSNYDDCTNLDYRGAINRVLVYQGIKDHLGIKANYDRHVDCWPLYREKKDLDALIKYVLGEKPIFDKEEVSRAITKGEIEKLALLHRGNIVHKNTKTKKYNNPELAYLTARFETRHQRDKEIFLNYKQAVNKLLRDSRVKKHLGIRADYDTHVHEPHKTYNEDDNILELVPYVLEGKVIFDRNTGEERYIQPGDFRELALLSRYNIKGKNEKTGKYNNPEIFKIMQRADGAHAYNDDFLNYGEILDNIFGSNSSLSFFGKTPSYQKHVRRMKLK